MSKELEKQDEWQERCKKLVAENDELMAEIEKLKWICKRSSDFIDAIVGFTGQNLSVFNWHLNGDGEPFDNFIEENLEENLVSDLKNVLEESK